ncbi:MAG: tetratricopeptide repeat protein [Chthonomonadetes bacterium]|nr:tetratricopeptide repeat protein [Chthonomonadetes bacterium]
MPTERIQTDEISHQEPAELLTKAGEWLEDRGHFAEAVAYYQAALTVDRTFSLAAFRLGKLAYGQGEYQEAIKYLRYAARLTPDHAPTLYHLSLSYEKAEQPRHAIYWAWQTLRYNPEHDGAYLVLLRSYAALQWWRAVLRLYRRLPARLHGSWEPGVWLALAYAHLGQTQRALEMWRDLPPRIRKRYEAMFRWE